MRNELITKVKNAMLAVQRYSWEQGVCMQALYELGDVDTAVAMAHDSVLRQLPDGRLSIIENPIAVADPVASGEMVWNAYNITGEEIYMIAANKLLSYLDNEAPRSDKGVICHNLVSFQEGYSEKQIWVDAIYMLPAFLAVMNRVEDAAFQIRGMYDALLDEKSGLLNHIYDAGQNRFVREKLWATGNGWALMGIGRVIAIAESVNKSDISAELIAMQKRILDAMIPYQLEDGRFHDILDDKDSFVDGASAMMMAAAIYRGVCGGWLSEEYVRYADLVAENMDKHIDRYGIIHGVCGCPHFVSEGTSAESMAAYLMMHAWANKCVK